MSEISADQRAALSRAENIIQQLLFDLQEDHRLKIVSIEVDTCRFANLRVSIDVEPELSI